MSVHVGTIYCFPYGATTQDRLGGGGYVTLAENADDSVLMRGSD